MPRETLAMVVSQTGHDSNGRAKVEKSLLAIAVVTISMVGEGSMRWTRLILSRHASVLVRRRRIASGRFSGGDKLSRHFPASLLLESLCTVEMKSTGS